MKPFKHIISYACDKNCHYCINEILAHKEKQEKDTMTIAQRYDEMKLWGYDHIMISGGEPVINKSFPFCIGYAYTVFDKVDVITAHISALDDEDISAFADEVLFSFHEEYIDHPLGKEVDSSATFYGSMVVEGYDALSSKVDKPLYYLKEMGFKGATVREAYPDGKPLPEEFDVPDNFSFRTHTKDNCIKESILMLPDLSLTTEKEFS